MDGVEEFTAKKGRRSLERRRIALAIFLFSLIFSLITAINLDGVTAEVAEHSEEVFR